MSSLLPNAPHHSPHIPTTQLQVWLIGRAEVPIPAQQAANFSAESAEPQVVSDAWAAFDAHESLCRAVALPDLQEANFVLTTRTDAETFVTAGADPRRILWLRGNASLLQCTGPCSVRVLIRQEIDSHAGEILPITPGMQYLNCPPLCPLCGLALRPNVLFDRDADFVVRPYLGGSERWADFLTAYRGESVLVHEMDVANERALLLLRKRLRRTFRGAG